MEKSTRAEPTSVGSDDTSSDILGRIDAVDTAAVYRKVDWRIMPLMLMCYFLQFLDKVLINYANIMGMTKTLGMHGQDFSWMATAFFIAYAVAEFPQGYLLQRFPVSKVLGVNVLLWGITLCCTAAAQNFAGMVALRTLLGAFESIITPALVLVTTQWYTKRAAAPRTGIWYCGLGLGQIVGGLVSFAAQHGSRTSSFEGWRIMFVSVGAFNLLIAIAVLVWLPNSVESASFLSAAEKAQIEESLALDQAGNGSGEFKSAALVEALLDPAVWLLLLATILIVIPSGVITTFSATLIKGFGYTSKTSALLNMPSGIISIIATLSSTFAILYRAPRWLGIVLLLVPTIIGAGLMSFVDSQGGALAGIYLINFCVAPLALIYAWVGSNVQSRTKKIAANAAIQIGFSIANIIGPQTFQSDEAPGYISAKITIFAVNGAAMVTALLLRLLYGLRNRRTSEARKVQLEAVARGEASLQELVQEEDLTDLKNPAFHYVY